jgi:hypothetical protein
MRERLSMHSRQDRLGLDWDDFSPWARWLKALSVCSVVSFVSRSEVGCREGLPATN